MNAAATVNMTHFTISICPGQNNTAETWHTAGLIYRKLMMMINIILLDLLKNIPTKDCVSVSGTSFGDTRKQCFSISNPVSIKNPKNNLM